MGIYGDLGLETIINAAGTLTRLGGSLMLPEVLEAMTAAGREFVDMDELHLAAGRRIAELAGAEAAHVCAGASAGIALMAAACMAGTDLDKIRRLPEPTDMRHKFVVQPAHRTAYEQSIRLVGGEMVEIGADVRALQTALADEAVAAVFYTLAWFLTADALPLTTVAEMAHGQGIPVIVDAAAEVPPVENLWRFVKEGADLVAFSGGKAIRGPQSTGFVLGRADLIDACRLNDNPHSAVGRPMKVCKEEIVGLLKAIELYVQRDHNQDSLTWDRRVARVIETLSDLEAIQVRRQMPYGIGQLIPHAALTWDEQTVGISCGKVVDALMRGRPRIAVQLVTPAQVGRTEIRIHPHTLREGEEVVVAEAIKGLLAV